MIIAYGRDVLSIFTGATGISAFVTVCYSKSWTMHCSELSKMLIEKESSNTVWSSAGSAPIVF